MSPVRWTSAQQLERGCTNRRRAPPAADDSGTGAPRATHGSRRRFSSCRNRSKMPVDGGIGRERRHDERESRLAIRVLRPLVLRSAESPAQPATSAPPVPAPSRSRRSRRRVQSLDLLLAAPDPLQPRKPSGVSATSRSALNHAAFGSSSARVPMPALSSASSARRAPGAWPAAETARTRATGSRAALRILLVRLARQRRAAPDRRTSAAHMPSSRLSHNVTQALPRVSASGISSTCSSRYRGCASSSTNSAVTKAAAVRQHVRVARQSHRAGDTAVGRRHVDRQQLARRPR